MMAITNKLNTHWPIPTPAKKTFMSPVNQNRETWFAADPDRQLAYTYAKAVGRPDRGLRGRPPKYSFLASYVLAIDERGYASDESTRAVLHNYARDKLTTGADGQTIARLGI